MKTQISALISKATLILIIIAASVLMPFDIYAAGETQIIPTWSQSSQQSEWSSKFRVSNFCESSNNPQNYSCQLTITVNGDYYGYVFFDGYINNQIIWDYQTMFISGGKGTFYYTWYANGLQQINKVNIAGLSLVSPTDNIDLSQIISILTSINSYEQQNNILLDDIVDNTDNLETNQLENIQQIKNVLSQLIISNGYLDIISKLRNWNIYFESYPFNMYLFNQRYSVFNSYNYNYLNYPIFTIPSGSRIYSSYFQQRSTEYIMIFVSDNNISSITKLRNTISISDSNFDFYDFEILNTFVGYGTSYDQIIKVKFKSDVNAVETSVNFLNLLSSDLHILGFYIGKLDNYFNTDFALLFGLSNSFLDNINIIANGTSQSNQQSQDLSSGTDSMKDQMDDLVGIEDSYNQQFNNSVNSIDFSNPLQQNQGLLGASNFVITVFNGLISNNPFSILIIIVCILLIGKKVIGK